MILRQDIVVALKIALSDEQFTYAELSHALDMSASQVYSAVDRCNDAGLVFKDSMRATPDAILELLRHGVKYLYPPERLPTQRGIPTAHSAPPLSDYVRSEDHIESSSLSHATTRKTVMGRRPSHQKIHTRLHRSKAVAPRRYETALTARAHPNLLREAPALCRIAECWCRAVHIGVVLFIAVGIAIFRWNRLCCSYRNRKAGV